MTGIFNLSFLMLERVGIIIVLAWLLVNLKPFRGSIFNLNSRTAKFRLIFLFSLFAIFANITGIAIDSHNNIATTGMIFKIPAGYSIANARLLSVTVSGIIGGPYVGAFVGTITGIHRILQGGMSGWFYVPSSLLVGALSGLLAKKDPHLFEEKMLDPSRGFFIGLIMEFIQMIFIALFSPTNLSLVKFIAFPMILFNSIGTYLFLLIISITLKQELETKAVQTHDVLTLANETLPYLRSGLNFASAQPVAEIIKKYTNFSAISLTSTNEVLSYTGAGSDHHLIGGGLVTSLSEKVIKTNQINIAHTREEIGCSNPNCPLQAAIVVPLDIDNQIIGTLKFYFTDGAMLNSIAQELAEGLASIFSSQLALGIAESQSKLIKEAEIKSLQAQINPHFFFNAMNTISVMVRKDPKKARELMLSLSTYFRSNLVGVRDTKISLAKELESVNAYLQLEQTRFPDKFSIKIDNQAPADTLIPPFTIQVLIENAIKHAFNTNNNNNLVQVQIKTLENKKVNITVVDNGRGIPAELKEKLGKEDIASETGSGTALYNLNQRLLGLYGEESALKITSGIGEGTKISITLPQKGA